MAEHVEEVKAAESLMDKISDKIGHNSSSPLAEAAAVQHDRGIGGGHSGSLKDKVYRIFGREKPVYHVFGGGKAADVFLWRDKKASASILIAITVIWIFFELLEYHLLTLISHCLILGLASLFLWSNTSTFINKSPPHIPQVHMPEKPFLEIVSAVTREINWGLVIVREIASGKDLKQFLSVIAGLWVLSILGKWYNFLTLVYIVVVLLFTLPVFYEKYDNQVDAFAEKAMIEIKKQYAVFDAKVLGKVPRGQLKDKRT